jgi:hypothetical protein
MRCLRMGGCVRAAKLHAVRICLVLLAFLFFVSLFRMSLHLRGLFVLCMLHGRQWERCEVRVLLLVLGWHMSLLISFVSFHSFFAMRVMSGQVWQRFRVQWWLMLLLLLFRVGGHLRRQEGVGQQHASDGLVFFFIWRWRALLLLLRLEAMLKLSLLMGARMVVRL